VDRRRELPARGRETDHRRVRVPRVRLDPLIGVLGRDRLAQRSHSCRVIGQQWRPRPARSDRSREHLLRAAPRDGSKAARSIGGADQIKRVHRQIQEMRLPT
jgi:hypothetical protein